jgi:hypothetical protein
MRNPGLFLYCALCSLFSTWIALAQKPQPTSQHTVAVPANRIRFIKAFVVDSRLAALRRDADQQSQLLQRLRTGRQVFIIGSSSKKFYKVAVSRRRRGWIHQAAVAVPSRAGDDEHIMRLIGESADESERIILCRLLIEHFKRSRHAAQALSTLGQEAESLAELLSRRVGKRIEKLSVKDGQVSLRDLYLNDPALDRYSRLGIRFDFNESTREYVYDGQAYREIINRFPASPEAEYARKRLDQIKQKLGRAMKSSSED